MFAEVAFPIRGFNTFTYRIPKVFTGRIEIGTRVKVSFGYKRVIGLVVKIKRSSSFDGKIKDILDIVDDFSVMTPSLWKLILWMSDYYMTPVGQVAKTVLPQKLSTRYSPPKNYYVIRITNQKADLNDLKNSAPKQYEVYKIISSYKSEVKVSSLSNYVSNPIQVCKSLSKKNYVKLFQKEALADDSRFIFNPIHKKITFSEDQINVISKIKTGLDSKEFSPFLLHGVTGSGKTEIYIDSVLKCLSNNCTAIVLLPEISLTPQIAGRFKSVFGEKIALWHSKLTQKERSITWKKICKGQIKIVIGARSAIFSPL